MIRRYLIACLILLSPLATLSRAAAPVWQETKIGNLPYVTFDSFCNFYEFNKTTIPDDDSAFTVKSLYGSLTLKANSREAFFNGRRIWLSYGFVRDEKGNGFVSRLDVIKTFDPLLRRAEMAPRKPVQGVVIDAGHGGTDNGTRSRANFFEKVAALDTAKRLQAVLKAQGIPTFMTRSDDVFITLEERCDLANEHKGWIFVSLHYNEAGPNANGVETYCLTPQYSSSTADGGNPRSSDREQQAGNKNDTLNLLLADYVHAEITKLHSADGDRGVKRARFVVLRGTEIPAILVEGGFLSNSVDARLITSASYRQKLAESVGRGIKNYMTLMASPVGKAPTVIKPVDKDKPKFRDPSTPKPATPPPAPAKPTAPQPTPAPATTEKKPEPTPAPQPSSPASAISTATSSTVTSAPARVPVVPNLNEVHRSGDDKPAADKPAETPAPSTSGTVTGTTSGTTSGTAASSGTQAPPSAPAPAPAPPPANDQQGSTQDSGTDDANDEGQVSSEADSSSSGTATAGQSK